MHEKYILNGKRAWRNKNDKDRIILRWHNGAWIHSITGHPDDGNHVAYDAYSPLEFSNCPPTDNSWRFFKINKQTKNFLNIIDRLFYIVLQKQAKNGLSLLGETEFLTIEVVKKDTPFF